MEENIRLIPSKKSYVVATILAGIFGIIGIHHFYAGRIAMGVLDLSLFIATCFFYISGDFLIAGILFLGDLTHTVLVTYLLLIGQYKDGNGNFIIFPGQKLNKQQ